MTNNSFTQQLGIFLPSNQLNANTIYSCRKGSTVWLVLVNAVFLCRDSCQNILFFPYCFNLSRLLESLSHLGPGPVASSDFGSLKHDVEPKVCTLKRL